MAASTDKSTVLGDTIGTTLLDDSASEVLRVSGAADVIEETAADVLEASKGIDVIDKMEVLVISGTACKWQQHIRIYRWV